MPLRDGAEWTYEVRGSLRASVEEIRVIGKTSVDGASGFTLGGAMGSSRLAMKGTRLMASELAGIAFTPAIVLADFSGANLPKWEGKVRAYGVTQEAALMTQQATTTFALSGRQYPALECRHTLTFGTRTIQTKIVFADGLGIASLEEHSDGTYLGGLSYLAGP